MKIIWWFRPTNFPSNDHSWFLRSCYRWSVLSSAADGSGGDYFPNFHRFCFRHRHLVSWLSRLSAETTLRIKLLGDLWKGIFGDGDISRCKVKDFHLTRWIIFKSGKLFWRWRCNNSAIWSEVSLIALIKTLESLEQITFLLFFTMNLSFRNFLIPDSSQLKRFLRKLLMYSVLGATWFFQRVSLLREWRGSKKYEKLSSTEIISPSRDDPVLSINKEISVFFIHCWRCYLG